MVQKKTTEAAAIDSKKSVNYGTFSASGDFALLPDDILYLVIFFLNAPSTASFKRVCKRFNALATNLDKMIQNNPSMIAAHLSTERLLERINELDKLFSKNILKTKVEINKFVPVIQKELQGLKDKMGDERDAPTKNLTNKLTQLQHKYTFSLGVYTDQLIQKSRRRTKIVDACTVAMLVLGVILLIIGLATRIKWFYIAAAEFLVCSILLFCIHRPCSMLRPNVTREVNEEITQALNKNVMESKILSNLPTFKVAKKIIVNRSAFFHALQSSENIEEDYPAIVSEDITQLVLYMHTLLKQEGCSVETPLLKNMFDFYISIHKKREKAVEVVDDAPKVILEV